MPQYEIRSVDLAEAPSTRDIRFVEAQWWDDKSPLVVVVCRYHDDVTRLRMDLDKKSFLDHLEDPGDDNYVQRSSKRVWEIVAAVRYARERKWSHT